MKKLLEHFDYTNLATQICKSNHLFPNFRQNQIEKIAKKPPNHLSPDFRQNQTEKII